MLAGNEPVTVEIFKASVDIVVEDDLQRLHTRLSGAASEPPRSN